MNQSSQLGPEHGILVIRGDVETVSLRRPPRRRRHRSATTRSSRSPPRTPRSPRTCATLVARPTPEAVDELAARGIEYVVLPAPGRRAGRRRGSTPPSAWSRPVRRTGRRAPGRSTSRSTEDALDGPTSWLRVVLLVVQGLAIVVVLVLAAPSVRRNAAPVATRSGR